MGKKTKKNFYAIRIGNGVENKIVHTWDECKALVHGYTSVFHGFVTEQEAIDYLATVDISRMQSNRAIKSIESITETPGPVKQTTRSNKKKKANMVDIRTYIPIVSYEMFQKRCKKLQMNEDKVMSMLLEETLEEWIQDDVVDNPIRMTM